MVKLLNLPFEEFRGESKELFITVYIRYNLSDSITVFSFFNIIHLNNFGIFAFKIPELCDCKYSLGNV